MNTPLEWASVKWNDKSESLSKTKKTETKIVPETHIEKKPFVFLKNLLDEGVFIS